MNNNQDITDEAFSAKEREIALLFGDSSPTRLAEPDSSEKRIARIVQRAREEPSPQSLDRIGRIMRRLTDIPPSDSRR
jgi:hypothetical protein